jgi:hypothetical protein
VTAVISEDLPDHEAAMGLFRELYLVRIASDPIARLHSGFGDLVIPADNVEDDPALYLGGGGLINLPDYQQLVNGAADRLDVTISGVAAETLVLASTEAEAVGGAQIHLGRLDLDEDWQPIAPVEWEAVFRADSLSVSSTAGEVRNRSIKLSIATADTRRARAPNAYFTDVDQRAKSPGDRIFAFVSAITQGASRRFGPK